MMCDNCFHFPICRFDIAPDECPYFLSNDLVEVVRCKDCKYGVEGITQNFCCYFADDYSHNIIMPDDFCSRGERKDNE